MQRCGPGSRLLASAVEQRLNTLQEYWGESDGSCVAGWQYKGTSIPATRQEVVLRWYVHPG